MFQQLAVLVEITAPRLNRATGFDHEQARVGTIFSKLETIGCATRNDDVIAFMIGEQTKVGLQRAMPVMDKVDLVALGVAEEVVHRLGGTRDAEGHVLVEHEDLAALHGVATLRQWSRLQMNMTLHAEIPFLVMHIPETLNLFHTRGWIVVIEVRV